MIISEREYFESYEERLEREAYEEGLIIYECEEGDRIREERMIWGDKY